MFETGQGLCPRKLHPGIRASCEGTRSRGCDGPHPRGCAGTHLRGSDGGAKRLVFGELGAG